MITMIKTHGKVTANSINPEAKYNIMVGGLCGFSMKVMKNVCLINGHPRYIFYHA